MYTLRRVGSQALALAFALGAQPGLCAENQRLPDLVILDAQVAGANPERLRIRVANIGRVAAPETQMELEYRRGGTTTTMSAAVPLLTAGERQWLITEVSLPLAKADAVLLHIDRPSFVIESDEENNAYVFEP